MPQCICTSIYQYRLCHLFQATTRPHRPMLLVQKQCTFLNCNVSKITCVFTISNNHSVGSFAYPFPCSFASSLFSNAGISACLFQRFPIVRNFFSYGNWHFLQYFLLFFYRDPAILCHKDLQSLYCSLEALFVICLYSDVRLPYLYHIFTISDCIYTIVYIIFYFFWLFMFHFVYQFFSFPDCVCRSL